MAHEADNESYPLFLLVGLSPAVMAHLQIFICSLFFCLLIVLFLSVFYSFLVFVWRCFFYIVDYYIYKALKKFENGGEKVAILCEKCIFSSTFAEYRGCS